MYTSQDRRAKPRIHCDYPGIIEAFDANGIRVTEEGRLCNLSASGIYLIINRHLEPGRKLSITIYITDPLISNATPKLVTKGVVVRKEPLPDGICGIAVKFLNYHFQ